MMRGSNVVYEFIQDGKNIVHNEDNHCSINETQKIIKELDSDNYTNKELSSLLKKLGQAELKAFNEKKDFIVLFDDAVKKWNNDAALNNGEKTMKFEGVKVIGLQDHEKNKWDNIINCISKIEGCKKILKTRLNGEDTIVFVSNNISSEYICKANDSYVELLDKIDLFFDFLVIKEGEVSKLGIKEYEICWEDQNA